MKKKNEEGEGSKFFAAQRTETFEERENRLNRELKEELMTKYASVFVDKLGEEDRIADVKYRLS